jgi:ABC-type antimicrobial peptide transport system permease subunit
VSIALIISTIIVYRQIQYGKNRPLGYDEKRLFFLNIHTNELKEHYDVLRNAFLNTGVVDDLAESSSPITKIADNFIGFNWKGKDPNTVPNFGLIGVSHDFGKTIGWEIKEGRDFSRNFAEDTGTIILNEAAVKIIGIRNPVGEIIEWNGNKFVVRGVVKDMVMESPYAPIKPTIFVLEYGWSSVILASIKSGIPMRGAISKIEDAFKKFAPDSPFEYKFTAQEFSLKFSEEKLLGNVITLFAILTIFLSCLGLFGLVSFLTEQRTKEIGVRKVMGASVSNIINLLSKDFLKLVFIAFLIATPIAAIGTYKWLQDFAYRINLSVWTFLLAAVMTTLIAFITVSFQAIRAAIANPVKSLRTE